MGIVDDLFKAATVQHDTYDKHKTLIPTIGHSHATLSFERYDKKMDSFVDSDLSLTLNGIFELQTIQKVKIDINVIDYNLMFDNGNDDIIGAVIESVNLNKNINKVTLLIDNNIRFKYKKKYHAKIIDIFLTEFQNRIDIITENREEHISKFSNYFLFIETPDTIYLIKSRKDLGQIENG